MLMVDGKRTRKENKRWKSWVSRIHSTPLPLHSQSRQTMYGNSAGRFANTRPRSNQIHPTLDVEVILARGRASLSTG
jgi:hypothetical protein